MKRTDFSVDWLFAACAPEKLAAPGSTGIIILSHIPYLFYFIGAHAP